MRGSCLISLLEAVCLPACQPNFAAGSELLLNLSGAKIAKLLKIVQMNRIK